MSNRLNGDESRNIKILKWNVKCLCINVILLTMYDLFILDRKTSYNPSRKNSLVKRSHYWRTAKRGPMVSALFVYLSVCLFVRLSICLFVCFFGVLRCHMETFDLSSALANEQLWFFGSLACHTFCDMGHPFIIVICEDPWHTLVEDL